MALFFHLNSIRTRMVIGFLIVIALVFLLSLVSLSVIDQNRKIAHTHAYLNQLEIHTLNLIKSDNDFFDLEASNEHYFSTRESEFLKRHDSLYHTVSGMISHLLTQSGLDNHVRQSLQIIDSTLEKYHTQFIHLEELVFKKGFKNYGLEGAMRKQAHLLEASLGSEGVTNILYMRRHEKDFIIRHDTSYLNNFSKRSELLVKILEQDSTRHKNNLVALKKYTQLFYDLASIDQEIGFTSHEGLRSQLNNLTYLLSDQFFFLSKESSQQTEQAYQELRFFYISLLIGALLFSILSGYWISKRLSEPIAQLSTSIQRALSSRDGYSIKTVSVPVNAAKEITVLARSFIKLIEQVDFQLQRVKSKSVLLKKKNKELKKVNRELDSFLYSTAHDLRSPLTSLLGLLNLMKLENQQPVLDEYITLMMGSVRRQEEFISQIVSHSKNKRLEMKPEKLNLKTMVDDIFSNHEFSGNAAKIQKIISVKEDAPFFSDFHRVSIIFNNLISNAIKYYDPSKEVPYIKIDIRVTETEAEIEFSDNGLGIEKKHLDHIFKMFYRAHLHSTGAGLGLFIFKETIKKLGGHARVDSDAGMGTRFWIKLPNYVNQTIRQTELELN
jgi:signal transduction histidine kinase